MTKQQYESGWENPDHHPDLQQRQRPMFDAQGRQVDTAPPPDPAPELDRMGLFGEPLIGQVGEGKTAGVPLVFPDARGTMLPRHPNNAANGDEIQPDALAEIRAVAEAALNDASPAGWAVALDRIVGLTR